MVQPLAPADWVPISSPVAAICERRFIVWVLQAEGVDPASSSTKMFKVDDLNLCMVDSERQSLTGPNVCDKRIDVEIAGQNPVGARTPSRPLVGLLRQELELVAELFVSNWVLKVASSRHTKTVDV